MVARIKMLTPTYSSNILFFKFILLFQNQNRFHLQSIGLFRNERSVQYDEILRNCQRNINFVHHINSQNKIKNVEVSKRAGRPKVEAESVGIGSILILVENDHA